MYSGRRLFLLLHSPLRCGRSRTPPRIAEVRATGMRLGGWVRSLRPALPRHLWRMSRPQPFQARRSMPQFACDWGIDRACRSRFETLESRDTLL